MRANLAIADKGIMTCTGDAFSAMIRWRSEIDPAWEVDTRHRGFPTAEAAAMAANGLGIDAFEKLQLERGGLFILNVHGQRERVEGEVAIWMKAPLAVDLPDDLRFERVDETLVELSASGLDGLFTARRFRVVEDGSGVDVDVRLAVGRSRVVVFVRGARAARRDDVEVPTA